MKCERERVCVCVCVCVQKEKMINDGSGLDRGMFFSGVSFFFNKFIYFIYLFLAALSLCYCAQAFSSCSEWGLLFVAVHGLLIVVASLVVEHGF